MAFVTADRVLDSSTSTGTGAFVVSGTPAAGYRTFSAVMSTNDTCYYSIQGRTTSEWEVGLGTYSSANTLTRTTVYSSSNSNAAVTFSAGTKDVFLSIVAATAYQQDPSGNVSTTGTAVMGSSFLRNRLINGNMYVAQRTTTAATTATSGTGSTATVTFSGITVPVGTQVVVSGVTPTGYNGTYTVTASSSGSVSYASTTTGSQTVAGLITFAAATVTSGTTVPTTSTGYPCIDRWFVYSTGANVTAAQVVGSGANKNLLQVTGAASVTAVGIGQRIEQLNSYDLAGQTCTLSVNIANSLLTTVTWTASYATTADTFGTIGTATKTQIATGTFTVTSTLTQYTTTISVPSAATTGVEILFTVAAQTSGTWQIGNVQLEAGSVATPFERPMYQQQFQSCQRYFQRHAPVDLIGYNQLTTAAYYSFNFPTTMRIAAASVSITGTCTIVYGAGSTVTSSTYVVADPTSVNNCPFAVTATGLTAGQATRLQAGEIVSISAEVG